MTSVRWGQSVDGVPVVDRELRVKVAADGRVLNVLGAPATSLDLPTVPRLEAGEARAYTTSIAATVTSSLPVTLKVVDAGLTAPGELVNGDHALLNALEVRGGTDPFRPLGSTPGHSPEQLGGRAPRR